MTIQFQLATPFPLLFFGAEAYAAAGGTMVTRLVDENLAAEAEKLRAEGWAWVEAMPSLDHGELSRMRRVYPTPLPLSDEAKSRLDSLSEQFEALSDKMEIEGEDWSDAELAEADQQLARLDEEIATVKGGSVSKHAWRNVYSKTLQLSCISLYPRP